MSSSTTGSAPSAGARSNGSGPGPARKISSFSPATRRTFPSVFRTSGRAHALRRCTWPCLTGRCSPASRPSPRSSSGLKGGDGPPPCSVSREPGSSPAPSTGGSRRGGIALTDPAKIEYDSFQKVSSAKSFSRPVSPGPRGEVPGQFFIPLGNFSASVGRKQGRERIRQGGTNDPHGREKKKNRKPRSRKTVGLTKSYHIAVNTPNV